jgi:ring-1,2-phenylacetyl-CoA epoxidase subunit PaaD
MPDTTHRNAVADRVRNIPDPEVPVITIAELGILRDIIIREDSAEVTITPTYSGCPAMQAIEQEIRQVLSDAGIRTVHIKTVYAPVWTTDWISETAKEKLRAYGIAPPEKSSPDKGVLIPGRTPVVCPHCGSGDTEMVSAFGSTPCKALYRCRHCLEPFDYFKCH